MKTGIIKTKRADKEFGFIRPDGEASDVFFHMSGVSDPVGFAGLQENDKVSFEMEEQKNGKMAAVKVTKVA